MIVHLRPANKSDVDDCLAAGNDSEIQRFLPLPTPYTKKHAEEWVASGAGERLVIADPDSDRLLGAIWLRDLGGGEGGLGFWVAPWARGRGIARAAVSTRTAEAFETGSQRVYLRTALDNAASQRVAMAAGYQREGIARGGGRTRDGSRYDSVVFARLATDPPGPAPRPLPDLPGGTLTDGTVTLRPLDPDDVEWSLALRSLPEVYLRSISAEPPPRAAVERLCAHSQARWLAGERATMTICDARTGDNAGELSLFYELPPLRAARLGCSVGPEWRGRGFASRAVRLVTRWAFDDVGLDRLAAGTAPDNVASQRVLEKVGFTREAFQPALLPGPDGTRIDNIEYVLRR